MLASVAPSGQAAFLTICELSARSGVAAPALRFYQGLGRAARTWQARIDARITELQRLSRTLDSCIGCGCLSLRRCALYNPQDAVAGLGQGARWLLGDDPPEPPVTAGTGHQAGTAGR